VSTKTNVTFSEPSSRHDATLFDRIRQLVDGFQKICDFKTINQRNAFTHYVLKAYQAKGYSSGDPESWKKPPPTLADVIHLMETNVEKLTPMRQLTVASLIDRLQVMASGPFGIFGPSTVSVEHVMQGFNCIDLSRVTSNQLKDIIAWTFLQRIDARMRIHGLQRDVRLLVVLDEAWKVCRDEDSLAVALVKEGRKYGYALLVSSQDATADLAESILANAGTAIIHHTEHPKYLHFLQRAYGLTDQEVARVQNLPVGEALIKLGDDPRPVFVRVDMEVVEEQEISPIQTLSAQQGQNLAQIEKLGNTSADSPPVILPSPNAARLLSSIQQHPPWKTTEHYRYLRVNDFQGNKAKDELVRHGLVESVELPRYAGKGRWGRILRLTPTGQHFMRVAAVPRSGGTLHQHLVDLVARRLAKEGWHLEREVRTAGGWTDLVAKGNIAIEVETRDFNPANVRKNLDAGFEKIVLICQSKDQVSRFREQLAVDKVNPSKVIVIDIASVLSTARLTELLQAGGP
jgi:hypothetical protein